MRNKHSKLDFAQDIFDLDLELDLTDAINSNRRRTVRYIRKDIKACVNKVKFFRFGKPYAIDLHDLSTRGAFISLDKKLNINKKLTLILIFEDGKQFEIPAKIVRKEGVKKYRYGIKFDKYQNDLGDYLLKTQTNLIFK